MAGSVQSYNGAAPTPFNTFFDEYAYAETMSHPEPELEATTPSFMLSDSQVEEAMPYNPTAFTPAATLSPTTSRWDSTPATRVYSNASSDYIPPSSRPVPAPPQLTSVISHDGGADLSPIQSVCIGSSMSTIPDEHPKRFTSRFRRKPPPTQVDRDTQRLQQLGYDAVLGRSYTFWSSFAIAFANIGCLQVRVDADGWMRGCVVLSTGNENDLAHRDPTGGFRLGGPVCRGGAPAGVLPTVPEARRRRRFGHFAVSFFGVTDAPYREQCSPSQEHTSTAARR